MRCLIMLRAVVASFILFMNVRFSVSSMILHLNFNAAGINYGMCVVCMFFQYMTAATVGDHFVYKIQVSANFPRDYSTQLYKVP